MIIFQGRKHLYNQPSDVIAGNREEPYIRTVGRIDPYNYIAYQCGLDPHSSRSKLLGIAGSGLPTVAEQVGPQ